MAAIGRLLPLGVARERLRRNVSKVYYDKQQKASTLHDLRTPSLSDLRPLRHLQCVIDFNT